MSGHLQSAWQLLDLGVWEAFAAACAILAGTTIFGVTGFGLALVVAPMLLLLFPPATVVVLTTSLAIASGVPIIAQDRALVRVRLIAPLLAPALAGQLLGVRMLTGVDTRYLKLIAATVVIAFAVMVARGVRIPGIRSRLAPVVAGLASGVLGTSTGMSGPPIVLFLTERAPEPRVFRASIACYFIMLNLVSIVLVARTGLVGRREAALVAALLPVAVLGRRIGQYLLQRVDQQQFRAVSLGLLILTGTSAGLTALFGLL